MSHKFIKSVRLSVESQSDHSVPAVLLVSPNRSIPRECYIDLAELRDFVAAGFDVTSELTFETMEVLGGAYAVARSSKLLWVVHLIYKYIRRGIIGIL